MPLEENKEDLKILKLVEDLAGVTAIERDLSMDDGAWVAVDAG